MIEKFSSIRSNLLEHIDQTVQSQVMEVEGIENPNSLLDLDLDLEFTSSLRQSLGELVDMVDILGMYAEFEKHYLNSLRKLYQIYLWVMNLFADGFYQNYSYGDLLRSSALGYLQHISFVISAVCY